MVSYRYMPSFLKENKEFVGNSVHAEMDGDNYNVWSYRTLIFSQYADGSMWLNNNYYSVTTSKIQNMIIRAFGLNEGKCTRGIAVRG